MSEYEGKLPDLLQQGSTTTAIRVWPRQEAPENLRKFVDNGCEAGWDQWTFDGLGFIAELPPQFEPDNAPEGMRARGSIWFQHPQLRGYHLVLFA